MQTTLENKKKVAIDFRRSALKRKNRVEEGRALSLRLKREQESIDLKASKMMKGRLEPSIMPTMERVVLIVVLVVRQTTAIPQMTSPQERQPRERRHEIPQMTSPQERQLKEQSQGVKKEHDIRFQEGKEHLHFERDVCEDQMEIIASPKHFQHLQQHLQQQQQQTQEGLHPIELQTEIVLTQPTFEKLRLAQLQVPPNRSKSTKGFPFEFELGKRTVYIGTKIICRRIWKSYDINKYTNVCVGGSCRSNESR